MRRGRGSDEDDREEVDLYVHAMTERAVLVSADGDEEQSTWLPRSQCDTASGSEIARGRLNLLRVPMWLLEREGLV